MKKNKWIVYFLLCINGVCLLLMWIQQECIAGWKRKAEKRKAQYMVMNQWVRINQEGKTLESYFVKNDYTRIIICGMNHIGKRLLKELKDSEVEIICGIDRKAKSISADIKVITLKSCVPKADAVIVTLVEGFDEITEALADKVRCPVISLADIFNEI